MTGVSANPRVRVITIDPSDDKDNKIVTPPVVTIERLSHNGADGRFRARAGAVIVEFDHGDDWSLSLISEACGLLALAEEVA